MDPSAAQGAPGVSLLAPTFTVHPSFSPMHPPSLQHNVLVLSNLATLCSCFSGALAGVLGLKSFNGFILFAVASLINAGIIAILKCRNGTSIDLRKYVAASHDPTGATIPKGWKAIGNAMWSLMAMGQETLLTFLLFWIGFYVSACCMMISMLKLMSDCLPCLIGYHPW